MRVIELFEDFVRAVAVSPNGRYLAAASALEIVILDWLSGEAILRLGHTEPIEQMAFTPDGATVVFANAGGLFRLEVSGRHGPLFSREAYSGGVAISPDGRTLTAAMAGRRQQVQLDRWELPAWRPATGFDFWSPFQRLSFSPNGEFLAGIDTDTFELRIAVTGGLNGRHRVRYVGDGFFAFARDSQSVVFGWETELHVMETRAGAVVRRIVSPAEAFVDAAFVGSGQLLATIDGTSTVRLWSSDSWDVLREYDWNAGGLTCLTATADRLAGVCGTEAGHVLAFDVDE
jgi:WD40 repeat protein